ncbi:DUF192 domain-containing protein [Pontixanthobacter aquaemixtae]|uniref:DUF192 domain-containing protein n=1 Tax=Pontixanthobacter aquaemixtae TaxID=1958940 RepID=A0A844ZNL8_9SPHN|nr:DUF192 domain-containing protein [Pontixanthobacter aquaemixtae]MXO89303.1 DUF192 domain-containing protein [Pontixanthobacter aquaemixtae]
MLKRNLLAAAGLALAACTPQNAAEPVASEVAENTHPISGLEIVPLSVTSGETKHDFQVEIARTPAEQAQGLMHRTKLGPNEGMIFPRNPPDVASFWMKNTVISLDIIFVGEDGRILNIAANTVPLSLEPVGARGLTSLVFEIPGGRAEELGIGAGDLVEWQE